MTNVYKHAFRGRAAGELRVTLEAQPAPAGAAGPSFCLRVLDNGVGLGEASPVTAPPARPISLGTQLVRMFSRQLRATLTTATRPEGGTRTEVCRR